MKPFLNDDVIRLRAVEPYDLDLLLEWENDSSEWHSAVNIAPFSRSQMQAYIDSYSADVVRDGQVRFMIHDNSTDTAVGMVDLFDFDAINRRASVGIFVCRNARGRGVGTHALEAIVRYAGKCLILNQLSAVISSDNQASLALFTKNGFVQSGCLREWYARPDTSCGYVDAVICQILL